MQTTPPALFGYQMRIPSDAFEARLFESFIQSRISQWPYNASITNRPGIDPDAPESLTGIWTLHVTQKDIAFDPLTLNLDQPSHLGEVWITSDKGDTPHVQWSLPTVPGYTSHGDDSFTTPEINW
jgi:hypothetical protein